MLKDSPAEQLPQAIEDIHQGRSSLHPDIAGKVLREIRHPAALPSSEQPLTEPMDIFLEDGTSMANPVSMLLADGRWRIAHTVSPSEADYPLLFSVSAYYRIKDDG